MGAISNGSGPCGATKMASGRNTTPVGGKVDQVVAVGADGLAEDNQSLGCPL